MQKFSYHTHINPRPLEFLGDCWTDGGVQCDDAGDPRCDVAGNSLAAARVEPVTSDDWQLILDAYAGGESIDDGEHFRAYLMRECGLSESDADKVLAACGCA